jgi:hypothetical protein
MSSHDRAKNITAPKGGQLIFIIILINYIYLSKLYNKNNPLTNKGGNGSRGWARRKPSLIKLIFPLMGFGFCIIA